MFLREVMGEAVRSRAPGKLGGKEEEAHRPTALCPLPPQPKPTKGRMRIHCLENVDKALQFLKEQKVHLENMGSHDIVDGNHRLTLGLVWTIILRFQVPTQCHLACALHTSAASPRVTTHMGCPEPHTLGQGTLIIKQDRGQRGC